MGTKEDSIALLRISEQVDKICQRLECLELKCASDTRSSAGESIFHFQNHEESSACARRATRIPLPDPRLVRRIIRQRQMRVRFFDADLFGDPAWDILLDLTAARAEHARVSITSLCIASGVPPTTALRWIGMMTEGGLLQRVEDDTDRRRAFIALTDKAANAMARYFSELGADAVFDI
jgi:DNA-binding MarR family transcriptional regulator